MAKGQKLCLLLGSLKVFALTGSVCGAYLVASALYLCFTLRPAIFNSVMRLKPPYNYDEKEKAPQEYYLWGLNQLKK